MQRVHLDGIELEYDVVGSGEPLLLIHGGLIAAESFAPLVAEPSIASSWRTIAYNRRGSLRLDQEDFSGAISDFDKAIRIDPAFSDAFLNRGFALGKQGDLNGAIDSFTAAIREDPRNADAYLNRAFTWMGKRDAASATADFKKALEVAPRGWPHAATAREQLRKLGVPR